MHHLDSWKLCSDFAGDVKFPLGKSNLVPMFYGRGEMPSDETAMKLLCTYIKWDEIKDLFSWHIDEQGEDTAKQVQLLIGANLPIAAQSNYSKKYSASCRSTLVSFLQCNATLSCDLNIASDQTVFCFRYRVTNSRHLISIFKKSIFFVVSHQEQEQAISK